MIVLSSQIFKLGLEFYQMQKKEILLDERDQIVITGAIEYAQRALEADQKNKSIEAVELYQRAIYLLENESRTAASSKLAAYSLYIETYKARIHAIQFQLEHRLPVVPQQLNVEDDMNEISAEISRYSLEPVHEHEEKALTSLIEDLDSYKTILQVLKSFLLVLTEGGKLTRNLYAPHLLWAYAFEDTSEVFYKPALQFFEHMNKILSVIVKEENGASKINMEMNTDDLKKEMIEVYKEYGVGLLDIIEGSPIYFGKEIKWRNTTKIEEYTNLLKKNLEKLKPTDDKQPKKMSYAENIRKAVTYLVDLLEYLETQNKYHSRNMGFKDFVYSFSRDLILRILMYDTKLKLNLYLQKTRERIQS